MLIRTATISLFLALGLSACAADITQGNVQSRPTPEICDGVQQNLEAFRAQASNAAEAEQRAVLGMAELRHREAFTPDELDAIARSEVFVGMSAGAARCAWGRPYNVATFSTAAGPTEQWSYKNCLSPGCARANYIYIVGGLVDEIAN